MSEVTVAEVMVTVEMTLASDALAVTVDGGLICTRTGGNGADANACCAS